MVNNLKQGILRPDIYEPELNQPYAATLQHYGVLADPCRVRDPDRKGTVENAVQSQVTNGGFQGNDPSIRLKSANGCFECRPDQEFLNGAIGPWVEVVIPPGGGGLCFVRPVAGDNVIEKEVMVARTGR